MSTIETAAEISTPVGQRTPSMVTPYVQPLGCRTWQEGLRRKIAGTAEWIEVKPGLYFYDSEHLGTYYSSNGHSYLVNIHKAKSLAEAEQSNLHLCFAGENTGAVYNVNYVNAR